MQFLLTLLCGSYRDGCGRARPLATQIFVIGYPAVLALCGSGFIGRMPIGFIIATALWLLFAVGRQDEPRPFWERGPWRS